MIASFVFVAIYFVIVVVGGAFLVYSIIFMTRLLSLKKEQNEILKELVRSIKEKNQ